MCKQPKVEKIEKLKLTPLAVVANSREIRSLSSEIYINTVNQRRLTKTIFNNNNNNINNSSSRGISSKIKRTLSSSTLITAHIFDTTMKPKNNNFFIKKKHSKKHRHHDDNDDQIFHQIHIANNRKHRIRNDLLYGNTNYNRTASFTSNINNNQSTINRNNRNQDSNGIPSSSSSFSRLRESKQYQQHINKKNDGELLLHLQLQSYNMKNNGHNGHSHSIQNQQQKQQKQQPPENLQIDNKFLEHEPGSYHENNLWVSFVFLFYIYCVRKLAWFRNVFI